MFTWIGEKIEASGYKGWTLLGLTVVLVLMLVAPRAQPTAVQADHTGFRCLSKWDGSHPGMVRTVQGTLRDPGSFEHIKTLIAPLDAGGGHRIVMTYRAKNGFGGYNVERTSGSFDDRSCALTALRLGDNE
ncbi:hypothetical protein [Hyphomicrobium sp. DY-1]|jgi:hypothetical protein|uniref:hypothetical protein n=1 Tax=Hyphomicrobium sp. DY-1 TaxID=3075650 RepID=UPI0039C2796F